MSCCSSNCCDLFQNQFTVNWSETDGGISIEITPKDSAKANALKDLLNSAKRFCQAFCSKS